MKVEVWSDIMCPFCYIGKRNYESALKQFDHSNDVEIEWHSFQLDPNIPNQSNQKVNVYQYLAERKGIGYEQSAKMHEHVVKTARAAGLTYNFDKAIVANSFDAHKMIQLAKTKGLGDAAEERLFYAYFTEGKDFGDHKVLVELGKEIGLEEEDIKTALVSEEYAAKVNQDIFESQRMGIHGVPFFVFDRKYAISGAQAPESFLIALKKSHEEWNKSNPVLQMEVADGSVCTTDGECN